MKPNQFDDPPNTSQICQLSNIAESTATVTPLLVLVVLPGRAI